MMEAKDLLSDFCVYIITSDNVGIGTMIRGTNLMVCCAKTVRNCIKVKYEGKGIQGYAEVVFLNESSNIAFCKHTSLEGGYEIVPSSEPMQIIGNGRKIQGEAIIINGKIVGIRSYPIIQSDSEVVITSSTIFECLQRFLNSGKLSVIKCHNCDYLNDLNDQVKNCFQCGSELNALYKVDDRLPIYNRIEGMIKSIGINAVFTRRGEGIWHLIIENVIVELSYHQRFGAILAETNLGFLSQKSKNEVLIYLLNQNYHNKELTLSIRNEYIYLCLTLYDHYLDDFSAQKALSKMLILSKQYKSVLSDFK
jgi:hypothetical protein